MDWDSYNHLTRATHNNITFQRSRDISMDPNFWKKFPKNRFQLIELRTHKCTDFFKQRKKTTKSMRIPQNHSIHSLVWLNVVKYFSYWETVVYRNATVFFLFLVRCKVQLIYIVCTFIGSFYFKFIDVSINNALCVFLIYLVALLHRIQNALVFAITIDLLFTFYYFWKLNTLFFGSVRATNSTVDISLFFSLKCCNYLFDLIFVAWKQLSRSCCSMVIVITVRYVVCGSNIFVKPHTNTTLFIWHLSFSQ